MWRACDWTTTSLTCPLALEIIEPYFVVLRDEWFAPKFPRVRRTKLACNRRQHDTRRHFASTSDDGLMVYVAPEMAELRPDRIAAILAHELGHAADFLAGKRRRRTRDEIEMAADAIASRVMRTPIHYSGPCELQTLGRGHRRPFGLR